MAATIRTRSSSHSGGFEPSTDPERRPNMIGKIEGCPDKISSAIQLSREDGVITVCEDRSIRVWLKRDSGQYWPSICHFVQAVPLSAAWHDQTQRLFIGLSTGQISEFQIADDFNSLAHKKDFGAHGGGVGDVLFCINSEWTVSTGRDKAFVWMCSETARKLGSYQCDNWCTSLSFDSAARTAFIGHYNGAISVLRVQQDKCELVSKLNAHIGSVRSLAWDSERQLLFSGSFDQLIIVWDIGGKKGTAYEMTGHKSKVTALSYASGTKRLLSASDNGDLVCWQMDRDRTETPEWANSDTCMRCDTPFFWNFKDMWNKKTVGLRQHHCRLCGHAVCDPCSQHKTKFPSMGYELMVRICDGCDRKMQDEADNIDLTSLASLHELKHPVTYMQLNEMTGRLITVSNDRLVRIFDCKALIR